MNRLRSEMKELLITTGVYLTNEFIYIQIGEIAGAANKLVGDKVFHTLRAGVTILVHKLINNAKVEELFSSSTTV